MKRILLALSRVFLWMMPLALGGCITLNLLPAEKGLQEEILSGEGAKDKLLLVPIDGFIGDQNQKGIPFLGGRVDSVTELRKTFMKASHDPRVRGVVLLVDSAGGSVTASDRIYHLIRLFKQKSGTPVIALVGDMGASGAYYASVGADEIWAHPTSVVGSIGVVIFNVGLTGLMQKIGVEDRSIASGPEKEMGSPLKPMTEKDRKIFQSLVDDLYRQFLDTVSKNRQMSTSTLEPLADGRVYTAREALKLHLIDRIGYRDQLIDHLKRLMHVEEFEVVEYREPALAGGLFGSQSEATDPLSDSSRLAGALKRLGPTPLYLWTPGLAGSMK